MIIIILLLAYGWAATDARFGADVRMYSSVFVYAMIDEWRGPPDAEDLEATAHFDEAGIAFDYPAVLRRRDETDVAGERTWSFEYGMFSLELHAPQRPLHAEAMLGVLADFLDVGGRSIDAQAPEAGRTVSLCGRETVATRTRVKLMGAWSQYEGFDLPAPDGEARMLLFSDEQTGGAASALAQATYARVFDSLRCDVTHENG